MYQLLFCLTGWKMSSAITGGGMSIIRLTHHCFSCTPFFFGAKIAFNFNYKVPFWSQTVSSPTRLHAALPGMFSCQSSFSLISLYHLCVFVERKFVSYQPLLPSFETEVGLLRLGCFRSPHKGNWFSRWCEGSQSKNHEYSGHKGEHSTFRCSEKKCERCLV